MHADILSVAIATWAGVAFILWVVLITVMHGLAVRGAGLVAAVLSWPLAYIVIAVVPDIGHWIERIFLG